MAASIEYYECPHCHHEVMIRPDHTCLACGKDRRDGRGVDPQQTMIAMDNIHKLPACCFVCGEETDRLQRLHWVFRAPTVHLPLIGKLLVLISSCLPGSSFRITQTVKMPVCPKCRWAARRVRPLSLRAGLDCRLLVHRTFRHRFEELNGRPRLEWERDIHVGSAPPPPPAAGPMIKI